jgi:hypothetical protein
MGLRLTLVAASIHRVSRQKVARHGGILFNVLPLSDSYRLSDA